MTVASIIQKRLNVLFTAKETDDFLTLSAKLVEHQVGVLVVLDKRDKIIGLVSECDLVTAAASKKSEVFSCTAKEMMTKEVYVCSPHDSDTQIMAYMAVKDIRHLPVEDNGKIIGMMSLRDAVKSRLVKRKVIFERGNQHLPSEEQGAFSKHLRVHVVPKLASNGMD